MYVVPTGAACGVIMGTRGRRESRAPHRRAVERMIFRWQINCETSCGFFFFLRFFQLLPISNDRLNRRVGIEKETVRGGWGGTREKKNEGKKKEGRTCAAPEGRARRGGRDGNKWKISRRKVCRITERRRRRRRWRERGRGRPILQVVELITSLDMIVTFPFKGKTIFRIYTSGPRRTFLSTMVSRRRRRGERGREKLVGSRKLFSLSSRGFFFLFTPTSPPPTVPLNFVRSKEL